MHLHVYQIASIMTSHHALFSPRCLATMTPPITLEEHKMLLCHEVNNALFHTCAIVDRTFLHVNF